MAATMALAVVTAVTVTMAGAAQRVGCVAATAGVTPNPWHHIEVAVHAF
ncbi:hypothetical protein N6G02_06580 [Cupriavidus gilardii]|nr:hypothetical protein [Cupriavidus gilardii]MCT9115786.1 hypothetical protein [Cupriavidus gilardii]QQE08722.1 hypothetical protein IC580_21455 [Cupriavidus sp. ISTL7]UXC38434.1 hypothetical protein N4G38_25670 [Cupriavidus gilardii]